MRNLIQPPAPPMPFSTAIWNAKHIDRRDRLTALAPMVQGLYDEYAEHQAALEQLTPAVLTDEQQEDLKHCYKVETDSLNELKAYIERHHRTTRPAVAALCQYCGLSYDASTIDHYLPKRTFAEFSTLSLNMIPCCGQCNLLKDEHWLDAGNSRKIVNIYYDDLPDRQYLFAEVQIEQAPIANFSLSENPEDYGGLESTIRNHYEHLDLLNRFRSAAPAEFGELVIELAPIMQQHQHENARLLLLRKAHQKAQSHSLNHWKVALYQATANSPAFLNTCGVLGGGAQ